MEEKKSSSPGDNLRESRFGFYMSRSLHLSDPCPCTLRILQRN
ncbi:rCG63177 [Rattus norvegicus]|uniref:RCG63177 n=1 Tax=Rattus norvegicus TaxID=10116 RepID=A6K185_RAT|nr:rCG63177 [Rattus norvegicus]